jgi:hypothetical protein
VCWTTTITKGCLRLKSNPVWPKASPMRIAAAFFLWFMEKNGMLYRPDGTRIMANAALVAMTLMIAESAAREKESIVRIVVSLICKRKS